MLIGIACFVTWQVFLPSKVQIERQVESSGTRPIARNPSITDILSWNEQLELTTTQETELHEMSRREQTELKPLLGEINTAMTEFDKQTKRLKTQSLIEIQSAARPVSELSFNKRQLEQSYAARAISLLTPSQRAKALELQRLSRVQKVGEVKKR
jgi:Spy/CpxP family protein refolding chaperone